MQLDVLGLSRTLMLLRFSNIVFDPSRHTLSIESESTESGIVLQPKVEAVLVLLLQAKGAVVSQESLLDEVWPGVATSPNSLARAISKLRGVLDRLGADGAEVVQTVIGRGYCIAAVAVAPETPGEPEDDTSLQSERREEAEIQETEKPAAVSAKPHPQPRPRRLLRRAGFAILAVVGLLALLALPPLAEFDQPVLIDPVSHLSPSAIAVLPFVDLSESGDQAYFGAGLSEQIINDLVHVPGLRVVSRTASFELPQGQDLSEIGRALGAGTLMEGSVRRAGNRIRVTAQLILVADGFHLWSETFEHELTDIFEVQDQISNAIVSALAKDLVPNAVRTTYSPGTRPSFMAYDRYLRGLNASRTKDPSLLFDAIVHFEAAIKLSPDYFDAIAQNASAHGYLMEYMLDDPAQYRRFFAKRVALIERAVALDPDHPMSRYLQGVLAVNQGDRPRGMAILELLVHEHPDFDQARQIYANYLMQEGRLQEAFEHFEMLAAHDPLSALAHAQLGRVHLYGGELDSAIRSLNRSLALNPENRDTNFLLWVAYVEKGMDARASEHLAARMPEWIRPVLRVLRRTLGSRFASNFFYELREAQHGDACLGYARAAAWNLAHAGRYDDALSCLERVPPSGVYYLKVDPIFKPLRGNPRFAKILEAAGLWLDRPSTAPTL